MKTATVHARVSEETRGKLEQLANSVNRSKSFLAAEAIEQYVAANAWQVEEIKAAVVEASQPDAHFVPHDEVEVWLDELEHDPNASIPKGSLRSKR